MILTQFEEEIIKRVREMKDFEKLTISKPKGNVKVWGVIFSERKELIFKPLDKNKDLPYNAG